MLRKYPDWQIERIFNAYENRLDGRRFELFSRVVENILVDIESGCWIWQGSHSGNGRGGGYGRMRIAGDTMAVHRVMFQIINGPIPKRRHVDHLCMNRLCCNPAHLEDVTCRENHKRRIQAQKQVAP